MKYFLQFLILLLLVFIPLKANAISVSLEIQDSSIYFEGYTCPNCIVYFEENGVIVGSTISDSNGLFTKHLTALIPGIHPITIYSSDINNTSSRAILINILVIHQQQTNLTNIYLPPTININGNSFSNEDNILISGYTKPNSLVKITLTGPNIISYTVSSNSSGYYYININTSILIATNYSIYSNLLIDGIIDNSTISNFFNINIFIKAIKPSISITSPLSGTPSITDIITITPTKSITPIISYFDFTNCLYIFIFLSIIIYLYIFYYNNIKKPKIYILSGPGKTGTSAISSLILKKYRLKFFYVGYLTKFKAIEAGFVKDNYLIPNNKKEWDIDKADIESFRKHCIAINRDIDLELETSLIKFLVDSVVNKEKVLIDSKILTFLMYTDVFKKLLSVELENRNKKEKLEYIYSLILDNYKAVWLYSTLEIRAIRSISKNINIKNQSKEEINNLIHKEMLILSKRQLSDKADYIKKYNLKDYPDPNLKPRNFKGIIIDSSNLNIEETYKEVIRAFKL